MKKLKVALVSLVVGLVLSIPTVAVLACDPHCAATITVNGKICTFVGGDCNPECTVCACAYNCGPAEGD
jgi:hypothetical protein